MTKRRMAIVALVALIANASANRDASASSGTTGDSAATEVHLTMPTNPATPPSTSAAKEDRPMSYYQNKVAELQTSAGVIDIRFFPDVAPNHVKNFIDLAEKGFYNGTKFHRVIPGFMIQGGDPNTVSGAPSTWGVGDSGQRLQQEFNNVHHSRGIVSMARSQDTNSASSQFFVCVADSGFLDKQYTVFGEVTEGMDVVDQIVNAPRNAQDRPNEPTTITRIVIRDTAASASEAGGTVSAPSDSDDSDKPITPDTILKATAAAPPDKTGDKEAGGAHKKKGQTALTNEDVIAMVKAELGDKIVIDKIRSSPGDQLDTSAEALIRLKKAGVSKAVIDAIVKRGAEQ